MELLIALIPALPLAGFLFAVLVGPRLDHVPLHGHPDHDDHDTHAGEGAHDGLRMSSSATSVRRTSARIS